MTRRLAKKVAGTNPPPHREERFRKSGTRELVCAQATKKGAVDGVDDEPAGRAKHGGVGFVLFEGQSRAV